MRTAIAVQSCPAYADRRKAVRETWKRDVPNETDFFFLVGAHADEPDVLTLACGDGYEDCAAKQLAAIRRLRDYDHVFFCDDDTYVVPDRLMLCGYESADYMGCPCDVHEWRVVMAQGGAGFWLSKSAMGKMADGEIPDTKYSDRLVGKMAADAGVALTAHPGFNCGKYDGDVGFCNLVPTRANRYVTTHFVSPAQMYKIHRHFREGVPLPPNRYVVRFGELPVNVFETHGSWWCNYGKAVNGPFLYAHEAERHAFESVSLCV